MCWYQVLTVLNNRELNEAVPIPEHAVKLEGAVKSEIGSKCQNHLNAEARRQSKHIFKVVLGADDDIESI